MKYAQCIIILLALVVIMNTGLRGAEQEPAGIILGEELILPGHKLAFVFSNIGFPENIYAMRGKKESSEDYIKLDYVDQALTFNVTSGENLIKSIYVKKRDTRLKGVPFKVGDSYDEVKKAWGEPDKKEQSYANYFYKGVTLKVSDEGTVELIAIYKPGKIDYDEMNKGKT